MIILTGGAGFIGQNVLNTLIDKGFKDIVVIDNNIKRLSKLHGNVRLMTVEDSYIWLPFNAPQIKFVFHLGARTNTAEQNFEVIDRLNLKYSKIIWELCSEYNIPLIYASSAATYGDGREGFDDYVYPEFLRPLNLYGMSKNEFDLWALEQKKTPPRWYGFKFFNVYGPHEEHKGKMASVMWHFYNQIKETGKVKLFRSHRSDFVHGGQLRDFIYVKDVVNVLLWAYVTNTKSGIYNLGTGGACSYNEITKAMFNIMKVDVNVEYIDIPDEIRSSYQYYTEAEMTKLFMAGYREEFHSIYEGIRDYIKYLENEQQV